MNIAIRVDASTRMGIGHLTRCRTLAKGLQERGASVHFVCRAHPGHQIHMLEAEGYSVSSLPKAPMQTASDGNYAAWLGVSQDHDADETSAALGASAKSDEQAKWDWLIVDHYGLDKAWEQRLRYMSKRILVIDDLANREHDCDVLLDQNFSHQSDKRYAKLLTNNAQVLLGPYFALLHSQYATTRQTLKRCNADFGYVKLVRRVLVFFGGTDPENLTGCCLKALSDPELSDIYVDIVVGANNPHREKLRRQAKARGLTKLHEPRLHLADLMGEADFAIGAGGTTIWERCCLGLPSLVISIAENQQPACNALAAANIIDYLGHYNDVKIEDITRAIPKLLNDHIRRHKLTKSGLMLVDGLGVQRVVDLMFYGNREVSYV
jgi:UDP-2,4-diacetamido-2,4,6-trideoxy-beta-L-altropyranose hydrolase